MTATKTASARKTLADQLDRLDSILDGLAENLDAAVADAVRNALAEALPAAVRAEVASALADPETVNRLREAVSPKELPEDAERRPGRSARAASALAAGGRAWLGRIRDGLQEGRRRLGGLFAAFALYLWHWRKPAALAAIAGLAAGLLTRAAPAAAPWFCGFAGAAAALFFSRGFVGSGAGKSTGSESTPDDVTAPTVLMPAAGLPLPVAD